MTLTSNVPEDPTTLCRGDLQELEAYVETSWPDSLKALQRESLLRVHRALWQGGPDAVDRNDADLVAGALPTSWLQFEGDALTGIIGLGMQPTIHRLTGEMSSGEPRFAWCGFDCLFLPQILGESIAVQSVCPISGQSLQLTVSPTAVTDTHGEDLRLTYVMPGPDERANDLRNAF